MLDANELQLLQLTRMVLMLLVRLPNDRKKQVDEVKGAKGDEDGEVQQAHLFFGEVCVGLPDNGCTCASDESRARRPSPTSSQRLRPLSDTSYPPIPQA